MNSTTTAAASSCYTVLPAPEETVGRVIDKEKEVERREIADLRDDGIDWGLSPCEANWEQKKKLYLSIERVIRVHKDQIPTWPVAGPLLHYGMTVNKMRDVVLRKLREMAANGRLLSESSLANIADRTSFHPSERGSSNLTRIWGAEFLKANLTEHHGLRAAEHYLVVDEGASEIKVQVVDATYPVLGPVTNAQVLAQKITGEGKAKDFRNSFVLETLGFTDFSDLGNIIVDAEEVAWVVDTEHKSFNPPKLSRVKLACLEYLKRRFEVLSGSLIQEFRFTLSQIGLESESSSRDRLGSNLPS